MNILRRKLRKDPSKKYDEARKNYWEAMKDVAELNVCLQEAENRASIYRAEMGNKAMELTFNTVE